MHGSIRLLWKKKLSSADIANSVQYMIQTMGEESMVWGNTNSPSKPKKARQTLSTRKIMATVFWDAKGILFAEFMECGTTITSEIYCNTLKKFGVAIQDKYYGLLTSGVVLCMITTALTVSGKRKSFCTNSNGTFLMGDILIHAVLRWG